MGEDAGADSEGTAGQMNRFDPGGLYREKEKDEDQF
jgi:hypothetical protein